MRTPDTNRPCLISVTLPCSRAPGVQDETGETPAPADAEALRDKTRQAMKKDLADGTMESKLSSAKVTDGDQENDQDPRRGIRPGSPSP